MFLEIASHAPRCVLIHDWRKNGFSAGDQREVAVGATSPDARTGTIPYKRTLITWTGPVGQDEDAEEKARREVGMAWKVFSNLAGLKQLELPEVVAKTDGERKASRHNSISPGRLLIEHHSRFTLKRSLQDLGIANLESIANDALLAAASRAHLPSSGKMNFRNPHHLSFDRSPHRLFMEIEGENEINDGDWLIGISYDLEGCLRGFGIALAIVAYMDPDATAGWTDRGLEIPQSATLRAALRPGLLRQAPARSERVAAFLRNVGLPDVAQEFWETYGSQDSATS